MSKKYSIFITVLFCLFTFGFGAALILSPSRDFSDQENRYLSQFKAPTLDTVRSGEFMEDFEDYVTDQFPLRDQWIQLKALLERALGKRENNKVYFGTDGQTLFAHFKAPGAEELEQKVGFVNKLGDNLDVPVYFSLVPDKSLVWADRLPDNAPNVDDGSTIENARELCGDNVAYIDLRDALGREDDAFYRTDHHWTTLGAYYAYAAMMEGMGRTPKALSDFAPTVVSDEFFGTTFSSSGVRWLEPDAIEFYVPQNAAAVTNYFDGTPTEGQLYDLSKLSEKDKYAAFLGGNKPLTIVKSNVAPEGAPKLMLIRDSYADSLAPFLCYNFSEIHLVDPRYYKTSMAQYVKDNAIDEVLVLYSVSNFVKDGNLFVLGMAAK